MPSRSAAPPEKPTWSRPEETWSTQTSAEALAAAESSEQGLSTDEAQRRLDTVGPNSIRSEQEVSPWAVLLNQFTSPLVYVLIAALVVTLAIQSWGDAIVIGVVLLINAVIGFIQEYRAESAVQSLMKMVAPQARVRRGGQEQQVESDQLVPGDVVLLGEGDMVPADLRLLEVSSLQINEAALTGESTPSPKRTDSLEDENLPPADQENMAFMGTAVTSGRGAGVVVATAAQTQLGEIAEDVRAAGDVQTPLQQRMDRLAKRIAAAILILAAIAFGVGLGLGKDADQMFLLAVSLSVAAIPAGLPVVMTVALAIGVRRMAEQHAVIRHLPAVETLGSTTSILSDKTGTLTQNRMTVRQIAASGEAFEVAGEAMTLDGEVRRNGEAISPREGTPLHLTLLGGLLNNSARLEPDSESPSDSEAGPQLRAVGDPMEAALLLAARKAGLDEDACRKRYPQTGEVPFQTLRRFSATIHQAPDDEAGPVVFVKGAPERVLRMCDVRHAGDDRGSTEPLDEQELRQQNEQLAAQGLRVLAFAVGCGDDAVQSIHSENPEGFRFVGMQGMLDPPRREAIAAVDDCHRSGIRVVMVTGDHAQTAAAIAQQVHIDRPVGPSATSPGERPDNGHAERGAPLPEVCTGRELAKMGDEELDATLDRVNVFARTKPDQKLRIVNRLKERDEIVAVTGDGVNDAPALKSAHLGAAMGETGTDVAKEASDMVITDDNFASVYAAVEQGRTAFRNIRMATFFLLSTGAADVLIILTALALRWELPLLPAQILWCNVVTNGIADVALGFEPGEQALYDRPPRPIGEGVLDAMLLERLAFVGVWLAVGTLGMFWWVHFYRGQSLELARVAALTTLVLFQKVHVFNCRSEDVSIFRKSPLANPVLLIGVLASLGVHIAALYLPWTQQVLHFQPLPGEIWGVAILIASTAILVNELHKWLRPRAADG